MTDNTCRQVLYGHAYMICYTKNISKLPIYLIILVINLCVAVNAIACPNVAEFMAMKAPEPSERTWIASHIYAEVKYKFAHFETLDSNYHFEDVYKDYIKEIESVKTRFAFDKSTAKLFASLHNGHTRFLDELAACKSNLPIKADFIQGKWIVTYSKIRSISVGSEILSINNRKFSVWADQQMKYIADSSTKSQRRLLTSDGYGAWLWPQQFNLEISQLQKPARRVNINRNIYVANLKEISNGRYEPSPGVEVQQITSGVVRISVSGFDQPENESKLIAAIDNNKNSKAILLDLRETEGGSMSIKLGALLAEHPFRDSISLTPQHIALNDLYQDMGDPELMIFPNTWMRSGGEMIRPHPIYHGKLYILTDSGCVSACEAFLVMMKSAKRATILGSPTWGINGNKYQLSFNHLHMNFSVSSERVLSPDGSPLEGMGVKPDIAIPISQKELLSGKDEVLQTAISYIINAMQGIYHAP